MAPGPKAQSGPGGGARRLALGLAAVLPLWSEANRVHGTDEESSAFDSNMQVLDTAGVNHHIQLQRSGVASGSCEDWGEQSKDFCASTPKQMSLSINKNRMGVAGGVRAVSIRRDGDNCILFASRGDRVDLQEAENNVMQCCKDHGLGGSCDKVGPTREDSMSEWCTYARATTEDEECKCPMGIPAMIGGVISWPDDLYPQITFDAKSSLGTCVDVCFAKSAEFDPTPIQEAPLSQPNWPVVMLAVYDLGAGTVHSNPVFCPNLDFLRGLPEGACYQQGIKEQCGNDIHKALVASGHSVPKLLQKLGCRELIYDGNYRGVIWIPKAKDTGCWAQGRSSEQVFWDRLKLRDDNYAKLYWLTSENKVAPFSRAPGVTVQTAMESCFGSMGYRLDFNPGTYSLLHHNCNKFSTEVMRFLDLPKFYPPHEKGLHDEIKFSATREESGARRFFSAVTDLYFKPKEYRSPLSAKCRREFYTRKPNCRRVEGAPYGDCPLTYNKVPMECYGLDPDNQALAVPAASVTYAGAANGVCRIPQGGACFYTDADVHFDAQCMKGFTCKQWKCQT